MHGGCYQLHLCDYIRHHAHVFNVLEFEAAMIGSVFFFLPTLISTYQTHPSCDTHHVSTHTTTHGRCIYVLWQYVTSKSISCRLQNPARSYLHHAVYKVIESSADTSKAIFIRRRPAAFPPSLSSPNVIFRHIAVTVAGNSTVRSESTHPKCIIFFSSQKLKIALVVWR